MRTSRLGAENPYLPVHLPEYGFSVGWAMCRNAMCANFGIQYEGPPPNGAKRISDGRYIIKTKEGQFACKDCKQSFKLNSNLAIRRVARQFLGWSLPFADCPNVDCVNHGVNVFEHHPSNSRPSSRPYARQRKDRAKCRACGYRFRLGTPLRVHPKGSLDKGGVGQSSTGWLNLSMSGL